MNDPNPIGTTAQISYEYFTSDEPSLNLLATYNDLTALMISTLPLGSTPPFTQASMNLW
jgi:hypothetical protein